MPMRTMWWYILKGLSRPYAQFLNPSITNPNKGIVGIHAAQKLFTVPDFYCENINYPFQDQSQSTDILFASWASQNIQLALRNCIVSFFSEA